MDNQIKVIIAFAADHLDREANKATVEDRVDDLSKLSQRVHRGDDLFKLWAEAKGGRAIAIGNGDGRLEVGADHLDEISQLKEQYNQAVGSTCSIGVGKKLSEAEKALTYAQRTGGNSIELFTEELEQELASLQEPEGEEKLFNSFFDKAEDDTHKAPALNRSTVKNAGGGMTGASEPRRTGPDAPDAPTSQEDEASENQVLRGVINSQPADTAGQFSQLAEQSEKKEGEEKQAQEDEAQDDEDQKSLRGAVVEVLKQFKEQAPLWEQLKGQQPDAYKTLTGVIQAMIALARKAFMDPQGEEEQEEQPVQKTEEKPKTDSPLSVECHTCHAGVGEPCNWHPGPKGFHPFRETQWKLGSPQLKKSNSPIMKRAKTMAKTGAALEAGKTGRHQVILPVGSKIDGSASSNVAHKGSSKVLDPKTGLTKWRQTMAGEIMAPDGTVTSSRNPYPDGKNPQPVN